jgi:hypothetical protein
MLCEALQRQGVQLMWRGAPLRLGEAPLAGSPLQRLAGAAAAAAAAAGPELLAPGGSGSGRGAAAAAGAGRIGPRPPDRAAELEVLAARAAFVLCVSEMERAGAAQICHHLEAGLGGFGRPLDFWWGPDPWQLPGWGWLRGAADAARATVLTGAAAAGGGDGGGGRAGSSGGPVSPRELSFGEMLGGAGHAGGSGGGGAGASAAVEPAAAEPAASAAAAPAAPTQAAPAPAPAGAQATAAQPQRQPRPEPPAPPARPPLRQRLRRRLARLLPAACLPLRGEGRPAQAAAVQY